MEQHSKCAHDKEAAARALRVQEELHASYAAGRLAERPLHSDHDDLRCVLQLAVRRGMQQLTFLVVQVGRFPVDSTLDDICVTTALHEAASHGQSCCVALLHSAGADPHCKDRYDQTPGLLAALSGHKDTSRLLAEYEEQELLCRAGTTASKAIKNIKKNLKRYKKTGLAGRVILACNLGEYGQPELLCRAFTTASEAIKNIKKNLKRYKKTALADRVILACNLGEYGQPELLCRAGTTASEAIKNIKKNLKRYKKTVLADTTASKVIKNSKKNLKRYKKTVLAGRVILACNLGEYGQPELPCRAGTTASEAIKNFDKYLKRYKKAGLPDRGKLTPIDRQDPERITRKILSAIGPRKLHREAQSAIVNFEVGEAAEVKEAVMAEVQAIMDKVAQKNNMYSGDLRLVGSSRDGTKLHAPDEFDVNIVIKHKNARALVKERVGTEALFNGKYEVSVEADSPGFLKAEFMDNLFLLVKECVTEHPLKHKKLSLIPPGLSSTKVGAALSLAWQGQEYPLLLIGVDLVPVLELPWHEEITLPGLLKKKPPTFVVSNTDSGLWRCSFALTEAEVLKKLSRSEHLVFVMGKMLLSCLKAEPWMPRHKKLFYTWFEHREWKIPAAKGFCFKNAFFQWLEQRRKEGPVNGEEEPHLCARNLAEVFRKMCNKDKKGLLREVNIPAYFGGDFEGLVAGQGAPLIVRCLDEQRENGAGWGRGRRWHRYKRGRVGSAASHGNT